MVLDVLFLRLLVKDEEVLVALVVEGVAEDLAELVTEDFWELEVDDTTEL